jgi:hypothetical protein
LREARHGAETLRRLFWQLAAYPFILFFCQAPGAAMRVCDL